MPGARGRLFLSHVINLLHAGLSRQDLREILLRHPPRPLLPPLGSPIWQDATRKTLLASQLKELVRRADEEAGEPCPALTDDLYGDYVVHGVRLPFERIYFERRRRLARAAVALLAEGGPRRAESFLAKLRAIFEEESWALPAHVHTPTGKDPRTIDLFAAETANLMAECLDVFGAAIPEDLRADILRRLHDSVFKRYLEEPSFWWTSVTGNWNAVCHQGVIGAALAVVEDPDLLAALLHKAASRLPAFLAGYGSDGGCSEGPAYWVYGFGWFSVLNEQLETRTDGGLSLFAHDEKIPRIAAYGPAAVLSKHRVVNFADCGQTVVLRPSLLEYLGRRLDAPDCRDQAVENYAWLAAEPFDHDGQRVDLFFWLRHILRCPASLAPTRSVGRRDRFFPDLSVWIVRGRDESGRLWELAAKGGHNDEHHNHNDVGGFILNVDGVPLVTEIGAPEYVREFFGPDRYGFLAARSLGHSLPLINGREQAAGGARRAHVLKSETNQGRVTFSTDIAAAYPPDTGCLAALRTIEFAKSEGVVRWTDRIALDSIRGATESALITHASEVFIETPGLALIRHSGIALELRTGEGTRWARVETHAYKGHDGQDMAVRRLVLAPKAPAPELCFTVELRLRR